MAMKILGHEINPAEKMNKHLLKMYQGIYDLPAFVPQFSSGGSVREAAKQFWQQPHRNPAPVTGRGNPITPQQAMQTRLQASANYKPGMKPINLPQLAPQLAKPATKAVQNFAPNSFAAPALAMAGADQVLRQPMIKNQTNDALAGLKAQAGIDPNSTPYPQLGGYAKGGLIQGPGTGTSDSIPMALPTDGFIIPADVVAFYGPEFFDRLNAMADPENAQEDAQEGQEEVPAKVSNGEVLINPGAVELLGDDFFNKLIESVTGQGAQPEMMEGEVHAARGYDPDALERINRMTGVTGRNQASMPLSAEKAAAQMQPTQPPQINTLQKTINNATGVSGGRQGGVPMSADMAKTQATGNPVYQNMTAGNQAADLRGKFQKLGTTNTTPEAVVQTQKPMIPQLGGGKMATAANNFLSGLASPAAVSTQLAGQVLNNPMVAQGRDEALKGLIQKAGLNNKQPQQKAQQPPQLGTKPPVVKQANSAVTDPLQGTQEWQSSQPGITRENGGRTIAELAQQQTQQPPKLAAPQIGKSQGWADNGLRTDGVPQTLNWNEQRFSNSGDPEQDAAIKYREGIQAQNLNNMSLVNAGLPVQGLVNENPAATNATANRALDVSQANEGAKNAYQLAQLQQEYAKMGLPKIMATNTYDPTMGTVNGQEVGAYDPMTGEKVITPAAKKQQKANDYANFINTALTNPDGQDPSVMEKIKQWLTIPEVKAAYDKLTSGK
jgi:hypothetical protein